MSGINVEYAPVVGLTVFGEDFLIIGSSSRLYALQEPSTILIPPTGHRTLQRKLSLQTNNFLKRFVDVASVVRSDGEATEVSKSTGARECGFPVCAHYAVPAWWSSVAPAVKDSSPSYGV